MPGSGRLDFRTQAAIMMPPMSTRSRLAPNARVAFLVALKFLLPLLYLRFPFGAGWANFVLDSVDGDLLVPAGLDESMYQVLDKLADWLTYVCILLWGWRREVRNTFLVLFLLRSVGQLLFLVTRNELALFFFPNLLEPLFLIYVTIGRFKGWDRVHAIYRHHALPIWVFILLYKLQDEWITHVANIDRSGLFRGLIER